MYSKQIVRQATDYISDRLCFISIKCHRQTSHCTCAMYHFKGQYAFALCQLLLVSRFKKNQRKVIPTNSIQHFTATQLEFSNRAKGTWNFCQTFLDISTKILEPDTAKKHLILWTIYLCRTLSINIYGRTVVLTYCL